ncbi:MAG: hypothetical protein OZSIB_0492 [Candidatus Ozemobacter sibiricus]|uniref:Uncharacterized protein n=1 Tax=Candidatus Ozemobacter sibiricus TaxID=2268124 RepID=A0A367ZNL6_9BACT|nr:MAG: hypothetical protein OZSIB_0492 [Candidatus Ozemobacter sibiricus]
MKGPAPAALAVGATWPPPRPRLAVGEARALALRRRRWLGLLVVLVGFCLVAGLGAASWSPRWPTPDQMARFLAGLPPPPGSVLDAYLAHPAWVQHAALMDQAWQALEIRQLANVRAWAQATLGQAHTEAIPLFYLFSGPDYLYADTLFPGASLYVLCGLEPVGPLPETETGWERDLGAWLNQVRGALSDYLVISFFRTKDLAGPLPLLYVMLARTGKTILDVTPVQIDPTGRLWAGRPVDPRGGFHEGVMITFCASHGRRQHLIYVSTDLTDSKIQAYPGFLHFCDTLGRGNSLLKSASYLLHRPHFSIARTFLLERSQTLVQDDSGIPVRWFTPDQWRLRVFGPYPGPIPMFARFYQRDLAALVAGQPLSCLDFSFGYRHRRGESTLILATRHPLPSLR